MFPTKAFAAQPVRPTITDATIQQSELTTRPIGVNTVDVGDGHTGRGGAARGRVAYFGESLGAAVAVGNSVAVAVGSSVAVTVGGSVAVAGGTSVGVLVWVGAGPDTMVMSSK